MLIPKGLKGFISFFNHDLVRLYCFPTQKLKYKDTWGLRFHMSFIKQQYILMLLISSEDLYLLHSMSSSIQDFQAFKEGYFYLASKDSLWSFHLQDLSYCWPLMRGDLIEAFIIFFIETLLYPWHHDGNMIDPLQRVEIPYIPNSRSILHLHTKSLRTRV